MSICCHSKVLLFTIVYILPKENYNLSIIYIKLVETDSIAYK